MPEPMLSAWTMMRVVDPSGNR